MMSVVGGVFLEASYKCWYMCVHPVSSRIRRRHSTMEHRMSKKDSEVFEILYIEDMLREEGMVRCRESERDIVKRLFSEPPNHKRENAQRQKINNK